MLQFPLYAGIYGVIKDTGLVESLTHAFLAVSTPGELPARGLRLLGLSSTTWVPSGGAKWAMEAPYVLGAARELGVPATTVAMAYAYGDMATNLIQPFWAIPLLGVARLEFRDILGYELLALVVYAAIVGTALAGLELSRSRLARIPARRRVRVQDARSTRGLPSVPIRICSTSAPLSKFPPSSATRSTMPRITGRLVTLTRTTRAVTFSITARSSCSCPPGACAAGNRSLIGMPLSLRSRSRVAFDQKQAGRQRLGSLGRVATVKQHAHAIGRTGLGDDGADEAVHAVGRRRQVELAEAGGQRQREMEHLALADRAHEPQAHSPRGGILTRRHLFEDRAVVVAPLHAHRQPERPAAVLSPIGGLLGVEDDGTPPVAHAHRRG